MKEISNQILKPLIDRVEKECRELYHQVGDPASEEGVELKSFLQRKIRQLEMLSVSINYISTLPEQPDLPDLRSTFRQLKLELRFAQRRWKRILLGEARVQRNQEKKNRLSDKFAA